MVSSRITFYVFILYALPKASEHEYIIDTISMKILFKRLTARRKVLNIYTEKTL